MKDARELQDYPEGTTRLEGIPQRDQRVAERAYQRYEARGREDGHDLDDWLEAEREVESSDAD